MRAVASSCLWLTLRWLTLGRLTLLRLTLGRARGGCRICRGASTSSPLLHIAVEALDEKA